MKKSANGWYMKWYYKTRNPDALLWPAMKARPLQPERFIEFVGKHKLSARKANWTRARYALHLANKYPEKYMAWRTIIRLV